MNRSPWRNAPSLVYFARLLASGRWKIGISQNPRMRVRLLACTARESIEVVAAVPGTVADEAALLRRFAHLAVFGREWFRDDGSIAAYVETIPAEHRGSFVHTYGTKTPSRPRDVIRAERAAENAERERKYRARHGHAPPWRGSVKGCAACEHDSKMAHERAERCAKARKRVGRPTPDFMRTELFR